jgi:hypothetical protein
MKTTYLYFLLLFFFLPLFAAQAAIITSFQDGDWNVGSTWVGGVVPSVGDQVIVAHDVILNVNVSLNYSTGAAGYSLVVNAGASLVATGMFSLTIGGNNNSNGINVLGLLDVYRLSFDRVDNPRSVIASTGEVIARCAFISTRNSDILIEVFLNIRGDLIMNQGNADTNGSGTMLIMGCLNVNNGSYGRISVNYCVVNYTSCICDGSDTSPNNPDPDNDPTDSDPGNNGSSEAECLQLLPVTYLSFTGKIEESTLTSNAKAIIEWTTASEINHEKFIVERSHEGEKFEEIGTLQAKGGKNRVTSYQFVDENLEFGKLYYRLKEVSPSNEISYSPVIVLETKDELFFKVFPNPISQGQKLHIYHPNSIQSLYIQSSQGQILFEKKQDNSTRSELEIPINLPKGLYFIQIYTQEKIIYRRLIVE